MPDGSVDGDPANVPMPFRQAPSGEPVAAPPPVNIRLSIPFLNARFHFAVIAGRERRRRERLAVERRRNPVATRANILFMVIGALVFYLLTLGAFLTYTALKGV